MTAVMFRIDGSAKGCLSTTTLTLRCAKRERPSRQVNDARGADFQSRAVEQTPANMSYNSKPFFGKVAEWSKAHDWKSCRV